MESKRDKLQIQTIAMAIIILIILLLIITGVNINIIRVSIIYFVYLVTLTISPYITNIPMSRIFRHLIVYISMLYPFFLFDVKAGSFGLLNIFFGLCLGLFFVLLNFSQFKTTIFSLSFTIFIPISIKEKIIKITIAVVMPILEEIFFRATIISLLIDELKYYSIIVSSFLFVLAHFLHVWADTKFNKKAYFYQLIVGILLSLLYVITESLISCIIAHFFFNLWKILEIYKRPIKDKSYDNKSIFNDY